MKNYAYNDFGNLIAMKTSNYGPQSIENEVLSHALNSETDAIAETSNSGPQSIENEVLSHAVNSKTDAIAETSNSGPQSIENEVISHALNSETNAITETSNPGSQLMGNEVLSHALNSETNAIVETLNSSNASPGDLIGWRDTPITEIDIRSFNPFRFSSEYHDDELNLIYYNYRHYNPATARWLSREPLEEHGGINLYNFLENDPLNFIDMLGLETLIEIIIIANEGMFQVGIHRTPSGVGAIYQKRIFYDKYEITINYTTRCEGDSPIIDNVEISGNMLGAIDSIGIGIVRTYSYTQTHSTKSSSDDKNNIQEINYKIKVKKTWSIGISLFGLDTGQSLSKTNTIAEKTITLTKSCCKKEESIL